MNVSPEKVLWNQQATDVESAFKTQLAKVRDLGQRLDGEKRILDARSLAHDAMRDVAKSWRLTDPGHHVPAYFFHIGKDRVVAAELIESESDRELALEKKYRIVSLHYVNKARCPRCHGSTMLPVIELYETRALPQWLVPCPTCGAQEVEKP